MFQEMHMDAHAREEVSRSLSDNAFVALMPMGDEVADFLNRISTMGSLSQGQEQIGDIVRTNRSAEQPVNTPS